MYDTHAQSTTKGCGMYISRLFCLLIFLVSWGQAFATPAALLDHGHPVELFNEQGLADEYAPSVPLSLVGITPSKPIHLPSKQTRAIVNVSYETIKPSNTAQKHKPVSVNASPEPATPQRIAGAKKLTSLTTDRQTSKRCRNGPQRALESHIEAGSTTLYN